jgi:abequosyltransferase
METRLSICIPTFNRAHYLNESLNSILASVKGYETSVEIVISDNASDDQTLQLVQEFQKSFPWIKYYRNDTNIGGERNFYAAAERGRGIYVWVFGDDDRMLPETIPALLKYLESNEYGLIICNYSVCSNDLSQIKKERGLSFKQDRIFTDSNEMMKLFGVHLGYISSIIIKKELFLRASFREYEPYIEYGFPFLYSVYAGMTPDCRVLLLSEPLFYNRSGNSGDYNWYKFFVSGTSIVFDALGLKGFSADAVRRAKGAVLKEYLLFRIIRDKRQNNKIPGSVLRQIFNRYQSYPLFWIACLPLLLTPSFLFRGVGKLLNRHFR